MTQEEIEALPDVTPQFGIQQRVIAGKTVNVPVMQGPASALFMEHDDGEFTDARDGTRWMVGRIHGQRVKQRSS